MSIIAVDVNSSNIPVVSTITEDSQWIVLHSPSGTYKIRPENLMGEVGTLVERLNQLVVSNGDNTNALTYVDAIKARVLALENVINAGADGDNVVNTFNELLAVMSTFPEGTTVLAEFANRYTKAESDAKFEIFTNKATNFTVIDDTKYPTTAAVNAFAERKFLETNFYVSGGGMTLAANQGNRFLYNASDGDITITLNACTINGSSAPLIIPAKHLLIIKQDFADNSIYKGILGSTTIPTGNGTPAAQSAVNAEADNTGFVTALTLAKKAIKQDTFAATLTFQSNQADMYVDQSTNISLDADFANAIHGAERELYINGDTINGLSLSDKFEALVGSKTFDNTKLNHIIFRYVRLEVASVLKVQKVYYSIFHSNRIVSDTTPPSIISSVLAANNSYIDVTFSEGVYTSAAGGAAVIGDFTLTFSQNGGVATNASITAIKKPDNVVSGSASALTGGETKIRFFLSVTGLPNGQEYISISPASGAAIYDVVGNAMLSGQSTGNKTLYTVDTTSPTFVSTQLASNNSYILLNLSEGVYTDTGLSPAQLSDFTITYNANGGTATNITVASLTQPAGGALGGGESTLQFNLAITGTVSGAETLTITVASAASLYDMAGNAMAAGQTRTVTMNPGFSAETQAVFSIMPDFASMSDGLKYPMNTFINSQVASGNWPLLDEFQFYGMNSEANALRGWKGYATATKVNSPTWNSGSNYELDGGGKYLNTGIRPSTAAGATQNDTMFFVWIKNWFHLAGSTRVIMGCQNATSVSYLAQSSANQINRVCNSANTIAGYNTESVFSNSSLYVVAREDSGNVKLYKNGVQVDTDAVTSNGEVNLDLFLGARNNNSTADLFANCQVIACGYGRAVGFNHSNFYTNLQTLINTLGA